MANNQKKNEEENESPAVIVGPAVVVGPVVVGPEK